MLLEQGRSTSSSSSYSSSSSSSLSAASSSSSPFSSSFFDLDQPRHHIRPRNATRESAMEAHFLAAAGLSDFFALGFGSSVCHQSREISSEVADTDRCDFQTDPLSFPSGSLVLFLIVLLFFTSLTIVLLIVIFVISIILLFILLFLLLVFRVLLAIALGIGRLLGGRFRLLRLFRIRFMLGRPVPVENKYKLRKKSDDGSKDVSAYPFLGSFLLPDSFSYSPPLLSYSLATLEAFQAAICPFPLPK
jgi:uncharacterized Tic20 family protein